MPNGFTTVLKKTKHVVKESHFRTAQTGKRKKRICYKMNLAAKRSNRGSFSSCRGIYMKCWKPGKLLLQAAKP